MEAPRQKLIKESATVVATTTFGASDGRRPSVDDILCLSVTAFGCLATILPSIIAKRAIREAPPREFFPPRPPHRTRHAGTPLRGLAASKSHTPRADLRREAGPPTPDSPGMCIHFP